MKNWNYINGAEIGNAKYDIAFQGSIDGNSEQYYFVYDYQTDPGAHRPVKKFKTRDEARAYAKKLNEKDKVGNSKVINSDREFFKELADDAKKEEKKDDAEIEKVGNYSKEELLKYAKQYGDKELIDHIMSGKMTQAELGARTRWFQYQWDGRDINGKIVDKEKAQNSKCGNSIVSEYNAEIMRLTRKAEQLRRMGQGKSAMEVEKQIEKLGKELYEYDHKPTKNSASDDKFAYVMREFDEGKLKTPDGKVVTDPEQAKAIAYSESKKAENGLARARNAMAMNRKAIGSNFDMNDYGVDVGSWSWDWRGKAPDKNTMSEVARRIKDYVRQIDKNVPEGSSDERDEVFEKLDRFMKTQGFK